MKPSDNELLGKFVRDNDAGSILELVQRHAPMVMGVCQSLLWHDEDAEDAFQATFLVLANKAPRLLRHSSVAGWLHQVAVRNCRNLRRQKKRKREVELNQEPAVNDNEPWKSISDLHDRELVQQELSKLPKRYREAMILCHIEGRSRAEAAESLNCTTASVKAALARGRSLLRQRLVRHGIVASAVVGVLAAATQNAKANMQTELVNSTVQLCQGLITNTGFGSSTELIQSLAQKELVGMNFVALSKVAVYAVVCVSLVGLPLILLAQNAKQPQETLSLSAQGNDDLNKPESVEIGIAPFSKIANLRQDPIASGARQNPLAASAEIPRTEDPLMEASRDSVEYWELMRKASKARTNDLEAQMHRVNEGVTATTAYEIKAKLYEEQAKVLQIDLLLKKLKKNEAAKLSTENASSETPRSTFTPPPSTAAIQPGEVLTIEFGSNEAINRRVVVLSDLKISLPLIGSQSVEGMTQKQLRTTLEDKYKEYMKSPMVDVYRELPTRTGHEIPHASTKTLQPGETLTIESFESVAFNRLVIVQADFTITVPVIGIMQGKDLTPDELAAKLNVAAKVYVENPEIQIFRGGVDDPKAKFKNP